MKVIERLIKDDMHGIRYFSESNPIWAIISMVATSDHQMQ